MTSSKLGSWLVKALAFAGCVVLIAGCSSTPTAGVSHTAALQQPTVVASQTPPPPTPTPIPRSPSFQL